MNPEEYNKELITVLQFLQEKHQEFRESNRIKSNDDRRKYAHAVKTVGDIAYNCNITPKPNPNTYKKQVIIPTHMTTHGRGRGNHQGRTHRTIQHGNNRLMVRLCMCTF